MEISVSGTEACVHGENPLWLNWSSRIMGSNILDIYIFVPFNFNLSHADEGQNEFVLCDTSLHQDCQILYS